ncbi:MAG TPA: cupin domain-containing protein [Hyalangium sp.]|nr:cupin domain-containing protein [Hyalangium sp.]HYI02547.1 cupin domain-containing protein [Hyalangium sp.]
MVDELVRALGLQPHPEGGYYKETYRARARVETPRGARAAGTAIYTCCRAVSSRRGTRWRRTRCGTSTTARRSRCTC